MAKQGNGTIDGFSGSLGPVVGYNWKGRWCVRARAAHYHDPRTEGQRAARGLFAAEVKLAGRLKRVVRQSLRLRAAEERMSECNLFVKMNHRCCSLAEGQLQVDYPALRFSEGPVAPVDFAEPVLADGGLVEVGFEKNPLHRNCSAEDMVFLVAVSPTAPVPEMMCVISAPAYRRQRKAVLELPEEWMERELHLYGFVQDRAGRCADSVYLGCYDPDYEWDDEAAQAVGGDDGGAATPDAAAPASATPDAAASTASAATAAPPADDPPAPRRKGGARAVQ